VLVVTEQFYRYYSKCLSWKSYRKSDCWYSRGIFTVSYFRTKTFYVWNIFGCML